MTSRRRGYRSLAAKAAIIGLLVGSFGVVAGPTFATDQTVTGANLFTNLDGGPQDDDGVANGTFRVDGNLILDVGATITYNDNTTNCPGPGGGNFSACPIRISVGGYFVMRANSKILAENQAGGGNGGNIEVTVTGDMTMCAAAGAQANCGGPSAGPGAIISARKTAGAGDTGDGGNITIIVGSVSTVTGAFYMEGGTTGYGTETGAKILATGPGDAGDITITAGRSYFIEPGAVVEAGGPTGTSSAIQRGGKIYIVVGCELVTEGRITSKGTDPGADLVHLEGCDVIINGLVESTGKGHSVAANPNQNNVAPFNSCDGFTDSLPNEIVHSDKPGNATACIEVWAGNVVIDSTGGLAGELNADIGNGGTSGTSWIDIYAFEDLIVRDGTGNDRTSDNNGHTYFSTYAVHANTIDGSDQTPNTVTAKVLDGPLTANGKAFESSATMNTTTGHPSGAFVGNGSAGGSIDLEASSTVDLDEAWVNASGDFFGGAACPSGSGTCGSGGQISVRSWQANLTWQDFDGDVQPNDSGPNGAGGTTTGGTIDLQACTSVETAGTDFHGEVPTVLAASWDSGVPTGAGGCAGSPSIPGYVNFDQDTWAACHNQTTETTSESTTESTTETTTETTSETTTETTDTVSESTDTTETTTETISTTDISTEFTTVTLSTTDISTQWTTVTSGDSTSTETITETTTSTVPGSTSTATTTQTTTLVGDGSTSTATSTTTTTTTKTTTLVGDGSTTTTTDTTTATTTATSTATTTGTIVRVPGSTPTPFNGALEDQEPASGGGSGSAYVSLALLFASGALIVWVLTPILRRRASVPVRRPRMRDRS